MDNRKQVQVSVSILFKQERKRIRKANNGMIEGNPKSKKLEPVAPPTDSEHKNNQANSVVCNVSPDTSEVNNKEVRR
jgi:hypothetical protein